MAKRIADLAVDGSSYWFGWMSPLFPVWLWHALADGTWACRCTHSKQWLASAGKG